MPHHKYRTVGANAVAQADDGQGDTLQDPTNIEGEYTECATHGIIRRDADAGGAGTGPEGRVTTAAGAAELAPL